MKLSSHTLRLSLQEHQHYSKSFTVPFSEQPSAEELFIDFNNGIELVHSLKEQCNLEAELENGKINLATKQDFNLDDAFAVFDVPRYG